MSEAGVIFKRKVTGGGGGGDLAADVALKFGTVPGGAVIFNSASAELRFQTTDLGGTLTDRLSFKAGTDTPVFVFNDLGLDADLRVEGDLDQNLIVTDASADRVGIGIATPDTKLHVHLASAGAVTAEVNSGLAVENSTNVYADLLVPNTAEAGLRVGNPDDADVGYIVYEHANNAWRVGTGAAERVRVNSAGAVFVNDNSNAFMAQGMTINQGANDDEILSFKSSDVAHGMTAITETDTFGYFRKLDALAGGVSFRGISEATLAFQFNGTGAVDDTGKTTAARAFIELKANKINGTTTGAPGANANLVNVRNDTTTVALIDAEGDLYLDATSNPNAWDAYDDVALLTAYRAATTPEGADLQRRFAQVIAEHRGALTKTGVLSEGGFVSFKALTGLLIDAVRQLNDRFSSRMAALPAGGE